MSTTSNPLLKMQPFKAIYVASTIIVLLFVKIPLWALRNLLPAWRPRRSWSIQRCIIVNTLRSISWLNIDIGGLGHNPTSEALETGKGVNGLWIDAVPDLITGDIKKLADAVGIQSIRLPGYWLHKPDEDIVMGEAPKPGEKVVLAFHGGGYMQLSAHPSSIVSSIPRDIIKTTPSVRRSFSVEYRLTAPGNINPFPAQLIDGLAGYSYLVRTVGFKPEDVIVVGDSAGGNFALALTRYLLNSGDSLDARLGPPGGLVLLSPWCDLTTSHVYPGSSVYTNASSDYLLPPTKDKPEFCAVWLAGPHGLDILSNEYFSPASKLNPDLSFKGFPRSIIVFGDAEILLDSMRTLEERMVRDLGREKVTTEVVKDAIHDFIGFTFYKPERTEALTTIAKWIDAL